MSNKNLIAVSFAAFAVGLACAAVVLSNGCSRAKVRAVNIEAGDYYTEDELLKLPAGAKNRYCGDLEAGRARVQKEFDAKTQELKDLSTRINTTRVNKDARERELLALEAEVRTLNDQIAEVKALPRTYKVRTGESLSYISSLPQIYNDIDKWWKLYEANKDRVLDPYFLQPDSVIIIPRDWPTR